MSGFAPSVKVFRGKVALQVEATKTAVTENRPVAIPTVTWTGAREKHAGAGVNGQGYDWENQALRIQVTPREMPDVLAALLGYKAAVEFKNHGKRRDKSYRIENLSAAQARLTLAGGQYGKLVFTLDAADRFTIATLCFRAFQRTYGGINSETLMTLLRDTYIEASYDNTLSAAIETR